MLKNVKNVKKMLKIQQRQVFLHERSRAVLVAGLSVGALEVFLAVIRVGEQLTIARAGGAAGWREKIVRRIPFKL